MVSPFGVVTNKVNLLKKFRFEFLELKPRVASTLLPGLPAYIIFMCVRHADYINSEEKIIVFLSMINVAVRRLIQTFPEKLDTLVVWLVNTSRLLDNLKQYSGEKVNYDLQAFPI
jgi:myosin-5